MATASPRRRRQTAAVSLMLAIGCPAPTLTQSRFDSWTTENGLPQNSIREILQTRDGYLWLATEGGLVRFDGARFVVFDNSVAGFEGPRIGALREDRDGTLWAGTTDGKLIEYRDGRFTTYGSSHGLPFAGVPSLGAARIEEDDGGDLWITWMDAVTRRTGAAFTHFRPGDLGMPSIGRGPYTDNWWRQDEPTLRVFVRGRTRTVALPADAAMKGVTGVNTDGSGNLWIRTAGAGVVRVSEGVLTRLTREHGLPDPSPDGSFYAGAAGVVWFADSKTGALHRIAGGASERVDLVGPRSLYVDREGSTWIGTIANGLHRLRDDLFTVYSEREGLAPHQGLLDSRGSRRRHLDRHLGWRSEPVHRRPRHGHRKRGPRDQQRHADCRIRRHLDRRRARGDLEPQRQPTDA